MNEIDISKIELNLLLEAVYLRYGYDFRNYYKASIKRRVKLFLANHSMTYIADAIGPILHDRNLFEQFLYGLSVTVTEMFRDPHVYKTIREKVVEKLKTWPFIKIWVAGCATGEEVYSLAILLKEEGLYDKCQIYATDINTRSLEIAKEGIYPASKIKEYTNNYLQSVPKGAFSDYYHCRYDSVLMNKELKSNLIFANHNLVTDSSFGNMHLILCRNVLIYFDPELQNRVLSLFYNSLVTNGFLVLGTKEGLHFCQQIQDCFLTTSDQERIFRKVKHKDDGYG
jgi:chemotaxis protein methyltransferase CheR